MTDAKTETEIREEQIERIAKGFAKAYEDRAALIVASFSSEVSPEELGILDDLEAIIEYIVGENLSDDELDDFEALMKRKARYEPVLSQRMELENINRGNAKQLNVGQIFELLTENFPCPDPNNELFTKIFAIYTHPLYRRIKKIHEEILSYIEACVDTALDKPNI